jgi:hypothetical protein
LTALQVYAEAKDGQPIYIANSGPIIRKPFYSGKRSVPSYFSQGLTGPKTGLFVSLRPEIGRGVTHLVT